MLKSIQYQMTLTRDLGHVQYWDNISSIYDAFHDHTKDQ